MKTTRQLRIVTGLGLGILCVATIFAAPSWLFFLVALGVLGWGAAEMVRMLRFWTPRARLGALLWLLPPVAALLAWAGDRELSLPVVLTVAAGAAGSILVVTAVVLWSDTPMGEAVVAACFLAFALPYFAVPTASLYHLHQIDPWLVVGLLLIVALDDTAAYFVGSAIGRRKMAPTVSPNKSWEGAIAGFATPVAVTALWSWMRFDEVRPAWLLVAAATAFAAQLGDLFESLVKRGAGVKDSSNVLPGHGGIYDRIDALLFAAPVFLVGIVGLGLTTGATPGGIPP